MEESINQPLSAAPGPDSANSAEHERHYAAFISYRHKPLDKEAAERIQKKIENYVVPKELREQAGGKKLGLCFRDEDELPASSSLTDSIYYALDHSRYLIVICTPDLPKSQWCEQEIRYFLKTHDRDHVLAVLTDGDPAESFSPYLLHTYDEDGNITGDTEPLAANIAGPNHTIDNKAFNKEVVRLFAALIGCPFDELWQRERRARTNRLLTLSGIALAVMAVFLGVVLNRNARIKEQNEQILAQNDKITAQNDKIEDQNRELQTQLSSVLVDSGLSKLESFDVTGALSDALAAVESGDPAIYDHRAAKLMADALNAYAFDEDVKSVVYEQSTDITQLEVTDDEKHVVVKDRAGVIRCLDIDGFDVLWEIRTDDAHARFYCNFKDRLIYHSAIGVFCHNMEDGSLLWSYEYGSKPNNFRGISDDGSLFAIAGQTGDSYSGEEIQTWLVILKTADGSEAGRTELKKDGHNLYLDTYREYYEYTAGFASDNSLFVCSMPSEKTAAEEKVEQEENGLEKFDTFFMVDLATFEVTPLGSTISHSCDYGIDIDPADKSVFFAGYNHAAGGIHTGLFTWEGDKVNFKGELETHSFGAPGGFTGVMDYFEDNAATFLSKDGRIYIISDNQLLIYNRKENRLMRDFTMSGKIVNACWMNENKGRFEAATSDGFVVDYLMNFDDSVSSLYSEMRGEGFDLNIKNAVSVNKGLFFEGNGYILMIPESDPGRLLRVEHSSDPNASVFDFSRTADSYTTALLIEAGVSDGILIYGGKNALTFDKATGELGSHIGFDEYLGSGSYCLVNGNSFLNYSKKYQMDGSTEDYCEPVNLGDYIDEVPYYNARLSNGQIVSWDLCASGVLKKRYAGDMPENGEPAFLAVWLDGQAVKETMDPSTGIVLYSPWDSSQKPVVEAGDSGLVMAYGNAMEVNDGHLIISPEKEFFFIDALSGKTTEMENACPSSGGFITALANNTHVMAAAYDDGTVCFYDADKGEAVTMNFSYSPNEICSLAFDRQDNYFLILTSTGRIDLYERASMKQIYSGFPDILKEWSGEHVEEDVTLSELSAEPAPGGLLFVTAAISSSSLGYGILLDPAGQTVAAEIDDIYTYDTDTNTVFISGGNGKLVSCPLYSLEQLREWAEREIKK